MTQATCCIIDCIDRESKDFKADHEITSAINSMGMWDSKLLLLFVSSFDSHKFSKKITLPLPPHESMKL